MSASQTRYVLRCKTRYMALPFDMLPCGNEFRYKSSFAEQTYRVRQHISSAKRISKIPTGFISMLTKNCLPKKAVLLLAISPCCQSGLHFAKRGKLIYIIVICKKGFYIIKVSAVFVLKYNSKQIIPLVY